GQLLLTQTLPDCEVSRFTRPMEFPQALTSTSIGTWTTLPDRTPGLLAAAPTGPSAATAVPAVASGATLARPAAVSRRMRMGNSCRTQRRVCPQRDVCLHLHGDLRDATSRRVRSGSRTGPYRFPEGRERYPGAVEERPFSAAGAPSRRCSGLLRMHGGLRR